MRSAIRLFLDARRMKMRVMLLLTNDPKLEDAVARVLQESLALVAGEI